MVKINMRSQIHNLFVNVDDYYIVNFVVLVIV